jgi:methionyl-tRNA formyltransferase
MTKVVFMGSPDFALPTLQALAEQYDVVGVVTQPDRASGRGRALKAPPVKTLALELAIPVMQPEKLRLPEAMELLRAWALNSLMMHDFGQILKDVLDMPRFGCINIHASLLPRWRLALDQRRDPARDEETGVTIMQMDVGLDTGPMLSQRSIRLTRKIRLDPFSRSYPRWEPIAHRNLPIIYPEASTNTLSPPRA